MIDHLNAVVLPVGDVEKCMMLYRDKLGLKLNNKDEESAFLPIGKGGLVLGLVSIKDVARLISEKQVRPREETNPSNLLCGLRRGRGPRIRGTKAEGVHFVKPLQLSRGASE